MAEDITTLTGLVLEDLQAALRAVRDGRRIASGTFGILKKNGYLSGSHAAPCLTARGAHILQVRACALPGDPASRVSAVHVPDVLDRLAHPRKGEAALVNPGDVAAARKFQGDLARAGLRPRISQSWSLSALAMGGGASRRDVGRHEPVAMLDARDRVNRACRSLGPDLSGLLIDVCLFEKSLTQVEQERGWPARSAKLAIALGLRALARHYGLAPTLLDDSTLERTPAKTTGQGRQTR